MPGKLSDRLWGPLFARGYDWFTKATEDAGLREKRRALLAGARGSILEIGPGTGINLELYPESVTELVLTEPDEHMRAQLEGKLAAAGHRAEVAEAGAESLPFLDGSFDTVVATLVLCTVPDPAAALREIARVLRPEGRLLFLEHVRAPEPRLARWQDRLARPWRVFGAGCHCNRDTAARIEASALRIEDLDRGEIPRAVPIVRPLIVGAARPAA